VHHLKAVVLIMVSAAAGAVLRRTLARYSANTLLQPLCAALLAGMIGALAVRYNLSSSLRLIAVCPCMILVPGPHVLNGAMDLIAARINLGASRLVHAGLIILAISVGLLLGMGILSVSLPVGEPGRAVPLWLDVIAAGAAVALQKPENVVLRKRSGVTHVPLADNTPAGDATNVPSAV